MARFAVREASDAVTFIGASADHPLQSRSGDSLAAIGRRFVDRYSELFGVGRTDLTELTTFAGRSGTGGAVRYQQEYDGVPVMAGQIAVQIDADGAVISANGEASADLDVDTVATVAPADATATAIALASRNDGVAVDVLTASAPELWIYDPSLMGAADPFGPRLVWRIDVSTALGDVDRLVLIDAHTGEIALEFSQREDALFRQVCDDDNLVGQPADCTSPVRSEGDAPTLEPQVDSAYDLSGETYNFFMTNFGRDSLDGQGLTLKSTVEYCPDAGHCPYVNAFWSNSSHQMVYGDGFANADDVVGHELTHGLTQYTSGLFYYADSGAINESMSDVMGEFIDLGSTVSGADNPADRWLGGEQIAGGAVRNMKNPPALGDPDKMTSALFHVGVGDNNGVHTNSGVMNKADYLITDGDTFNGQTIVGLGTAKAAAIFYQLEATLLTPGSDYLDLANVLPQACANLVGVAPQFITTTDCQQVSKAVLATEMNLRATAPGAALTAPLCSTGVQNAVLLGDDMEVPSSGTWVSSATGGGAPWASYTGSSVSGTRSMRVVDAAGTRGISTLASVAPTAIPAGTSFLRFDHSFYTDSRTSPSVDMYDGGVVEYSTDGVTWLDMNTLPRLNGYNGTLANTFDGIPPLPNELAGRAAFGVTSPSYETTRVDLSSLAGQNVLFRFRFSTDNYPTGAFPGWFIDDVFVYTCGSPLTPGAPRNVLPGPAGPGSAVVVWNAPYTDGGSPITGYVVTPYIGAVAQAPIVSPGTATNAVVTGLTGGTAYSFRVAATNALGTGPQSPNSPLLAPQTAPGAPGDVVAQPLDGAALVFWTPPASDGGASITGYTIVPSINGVAQASVAGGTGPSFTVPGLVNGTAYTFTVAAVNSIGTGPPSAASAPVTPTAKFHSLVPARLMETRDGLSTVDGQFNGIGLRTAGSVTALTVAGRGGVAADAAAVVLNVTVTDARAPGYVTLFPCGGETPTASNLNYVTGLTIPNMVVTKVGTNGQVCIFTQSDVHLLADVAGYFPPASSLTSLLPARLLDSRVPGTTVDGQGSAIGVRSAGSVTEVQVAGRASIPGDASAAVLNVTVTEPQGPGYVTVYPCGSEPPTASNLNYVKGQSIPNAVVSKIGSDGKVCVFTQAATHLIVDVNGYFPAVSSLEPLLPARLLESRTPGTTVDGQSQGIGLRPAGSVTVVQVAGRAGVPADASAVVLNVTVTEAAGAGYATVYPCGGDPPTASNLNYGSGTTIANAAITKLSGDGTVCIFTQQATHLLADVTAYFAG